MFPLALATLSKKMSPFITLNFLARFETDARMEENAVQPIVQTVQTRFALSMMNEALKELGRSPVPTPYKWAIYALPSVLFLFANVLPKGIAQSGVEALKNNAGSLIRLAVLTSQVALFYFTGGTSALIGLGLMSANFLDEAGLLPDRISRIYHSAQAPLWLITSLFSAQSAFGLFRWGVLSLVSIEAQFGFPISRRIGGHLFSPNTIQGLKSLITAEFGSQHVRFNLDLANRIEQRAVDLRLCFSHLAMSALPPTPSVELENLLNFWERISWKPELRQAIKQQWPKTAVYQLKIVVASLLRQPKADRQRFLNEFASSANPQDFIAQKFKAHLNADRNPSDVLIKTIGQKLQLERTRAIFDMAASANNPGTMAVRSRIQKIHKLGVFQNRDVLQFGLIQPGLSLPFALSPPFAPMSQRQIGIILGEIGQTPADILQSVRQIPNLDQMVRNWWKAHLQDLATPKPRFTSLPLSSLNDLVDLSNAESAMRRLGLFLALAKTQGQPAIAEADLDALQINDQLLLGTLIEAGILEPVPENPPPVPPPAN